jgi:tRNA(Ile2) C34 agmatinyltransferase TiaS
MGADRFRYLIAAGLVVAIVGSVSAGAHHSPASYDLAKRSSVTGVIKSVYFRNPHGAMVLTASDGKEWKVETSAANLLRRRGWEFARIKPGMKVVVSGHLNKTVQNDIYIRLIKLPDGTEFGDKEGKDAALD